MTQIELYIIIGHVDDVLCELRLIIGILFVARCSRFHKGSYDRRGFKLAFMECTFVVANEPNSQDVFWYNREAFLGTVSPTSYCVHV